MEVVPVTLESEHVRLEPLTMAHEAALAAAAADGELWNTQVTIIPRPEAVKDYIQFALDGLAQGDQLPFVIERKPQPDTTSTDAAVNSANRIVGSTRFYEVSPQDR